MRNRTFFRRKKRQRRAETKEVPYPPRELRALVGPLDDEYYDNPSGAPVFPQLPDEDAYRQVFDFGCGCGRVARQLIRQVPRPERYVGIDIHSGMIDWCQANLAPATEGFEFKHHDVFNILLNPGDEKPRTLPLPVGDKQFSLVLAISVFTHLVESQAVHYLSEVSRILRPDGRFLATWFLFDKQHFPMMVEDQNALYTDPVDPTQAVIFDRSWLRGAAREAGLTITDIEAPATRGSWSYIIMTPTREGLEEAAFPRDEAPLVDAPWPNWLYEKT